MQTGTDQLGVVKKNAEPFYSYLPHAPNHLANESSGAGQSSGSGRERVSRERVSRERVRPQNHLENGSVERVRSGTGQSANPLHERVAIRPQIHRANVAES